jgi:uncharacterized damage-inducible protein DinB
MNTEIQTIIANLQEVLDGHPWFGRAVNEILDEVDASSVYIKPNENSHSLIDLLYHMVTWAQFTRDRIAKKPITNMAAFEATDWRSIDPALHTWQQGLADLKAAHASIIEHLQIRKDIFLEEIVDYRQYNFRYLLNGLIQHNIYHAGQIAYVNKLLQGG